MKHLLRKCLYLGILSLMSITANAYDCCVDGIYYDLDNSNRTASVTYYSDSNNYRDNSSAYQGSLIIPLTITYNGISYDVTSIGFAAFVYCSDLTSVNIPNSVKSIGNYAFNNCSGLNSIDIPNSATSIGYAAFANCSSLTTIVIPNSVKSIGGYAFAYCDDLTSIISYIEEPFAIDESVFFSWDNEIETIKFTTATLYVPAGTKEKYHETDGWWNFLNYSNIVENAPNTFIALTAEGVPVTYSILDEDDKTCQVGRGLFTAAINSNTTGTVSIPEKTNGYTVIGLSRCAFYACSGLTYIDIPNSVTSIGVYAFYGCINLASITIPNYVTSIGDYAFNGCINLTSITIPTNVTSIGYAAFVDCSGLGSIQVDNGNVVYDSRDNCNAIIQTENNELIAGCMNTVIPNSVTSIGEGSFCGCDCLTSIDIPNSVISIGDYAFADCSGLNFMNIPNSVKSIGYSTFQGCSGLTSIVIPNSVISIGDYAFADCSGLTFIRVDKGNAFFDSRDNCNAIIKTDNNELIVGCVNTVIPKSVTSIRTAFYGCKYLTSMEIPNNVTTIGDDAFFDCIALTSITIPNSVLSIGDSAFNGCSGLTSITIPNNVESIWEYAFEYCDGLTSITIPNSVKSIGKYAFAWCDGLSSITIPDSVLSIGSDAFYGTSWFDNQPDGLVYAGKVAYQYKGTMPESTEIILEEGTLGIGGGAFNYCYCLTSIIIPNSVFSIGDDVFQGCSGLTSITIPNSVKSIGKYAFAWCDALTSITIPNSVLSIGSRAFAYTGLISLSSYIEEPFAIADNVFEGCDNVTLYVPAGTKSKYETADGWKNFTNIVEVDSNPFINFADATVKTICVEHWDTNGDGMLSYDEAAAVTDLGWVFSYNKEITSFDELQYFTGLTSLGNGAFRGCSKLTSIFIPNSMTSIGNYAFEYCSDLTSITIPSSVTSIGNNVFRGCI